MAEEVQIVGTDARAKLRNPIGVVALSLVTLGIYFFFWWFFVNRELRDLGRARNADLGQSPGTSVLAVTLGALMVIPAIVSMWTTSGRIENAQEAVGMQRRVSGPIVFILLLLIGPVGIWYAQSELNKALEAQRAGGGEPSGLPGAAPATAPPAPAPPAPAPAEPRPEAPEAGPQSPRQTDA